MFGTGDHGFSRVGAMIGAQIHEASMALKKSHTAEWNYCVQYVLLNAYMVTQGAYNVRPPSYKLV